MEKHNETCMIDISPLWFSRWGNNSTRKLIFQVWWSISVLLRLYIKCIQLHFKKFQFSESYNIRPKEMKANGWRKLATVSLRSYIFNLQVKKEKRGNMWRRDGLYSYFIIHITIVLASTLLGHSLNSMAHECLKRLINNKRTMNCPSTNYQESHAYLKSQPQNIGWFGSTSFSAV